MSENHTALSAKRLRACRENARETLEQVGRLTGVNKSTVLRWERGETSKINRPTMELLARHYHVNLRWLMGLDEDRREAAVCAGDEMPPPVKAIPVLEPPYDSDFPVDTEPVDTRRVPDAADCFWMRAAGDSMAPTIRENDRLLIRRQPRVETGSYALVLCGETPVIRRVVCGDGWMELQSDNPYYPARRIPTEGAQQAGEAVRILGAVLECRRRFS